jgi:hypothetical protein
LVPGFQSSFAKQAMLAKERQSNVSVQEKYEQEAALEALTKLQEDAQDLEWLRELDKRMLQLQWCVAGLALAGFLLAALVSEIVSSSDSVGGVPVWVNILKALTSCCTLVQVFLMARQLQIKADYADTQSTLQERGRGLKPADMQKETPSASFVRSIRQHGVLPFVLGLYNLIHPVPGLSFSVTIEQLGMRPRYSVEALIAGAMVLRVYHILVLFKLKMITKFLSLDSSLVVRNEDAINQVRVCVCVRCSDRSMHPEP